MEKQQKAWWHALPEHFEVEWKMSLWNSHSKVCLGICVQLTTFECLAIKLIGTREQEFCLSRKITFVTVYLCNKNTHTFKINKYIGDFLLKKLHIKMYC